MYKAFLIKYAEIGIKGKNRHLFEDALVRQICYALRNVEGTFNVPIAELDHDWYILDNFLRHGR